MQPIVEFQNISKEYPGVVANNNVSFEITRQSIHAILGENGAGKSTLVKILYGHVKPDKGQIIINSDLATINSPTTAQSLGINMVFQHFSLFESLTVAENLILGMSEKISLSKLNSKSESICNKYGFNLNLNSPISALSVGQRQSVEIVRSLLNNPEILIMDEPTSVLTPEEIKKLFKIIKKLVADGLTVIFISHKLDEIINLSDHVTIMRNGKVVSNLNTKNEDPESLGYKMLGYKVSKTKQINNINYSEDVLSLNNLSSYSQDPFTTNLNKINFKLKKGQIFGIAGVAGNGQKELMEILLNENDYEFNGDIIFKNININKLSTFQRKSLSISYVTEQRLGHSAVPEMSLSENILLSMNHKTDFKKGDFINFDRINSYANDVIKNFNVDTPSFKVKAGKLSGGNLQKFIIGREIMSNPELLILSQPTWGIDAGSEAFIKKSLIELSQSGVSIIIISHDLDELLEVCHNIAVLYEGSLSKSLNVENIDITKLGKYMGGLFD